MIRSDTASPTYRQRAAARRKRWSVNANAAKARKRMEQPPESWTTHEHVLRFAISPDGRHVALAMPNGWQRCGSERTIRAALARAIWTRTQIPR